MISILSHNIYSPLGRTSKENFDAVLEGKSALTPGLFLFNIPECVCASVFDREQIEHDAESAHIDPALSILEKVAILSASDAVAKSGIDTSNSKTIFIISSTKGNVDLLEKNLYDEGCYLSGSAQRIAKFFGNPNTPIVVSNACISGVSAQMLANRLISSGNYDTAVVIGVDILSRFIISGFQSFMALSQQECRPYDKWRNGLNLGEAAATLILSNSKNRKGDIMSSVTASDDTHHDNYWQLISVSSHNDANHISGPSRTGQGAYLVLQDLLRFTSPEKLGFINAHGTSTLYNDEMESIALERAALSPIPVNSLKGYYGHTLGAAGVVETILSTLALENGLVLPTRGFQQQGTSRSINVSSEQRTTEGIDFIKLLSGFGGSNAGILYRYINPHKRHIDIKRSINSHKYPETELINEVTVTPEGIQFADSELECKNLSLIEIYREKVESYPKFFKMDNLSKLGFLAAELLLSPFDAKVKENTAVILFNKSGSLNTDRNYQETIRDDAGYYPSPATFVYTLANIVTGEIAIRHKIYGETSFYILDNESPDLQSMIVDSTLHNSSPSLILTGWLEYENESDYYAHFRLLRPIL